MSFSSWLYGKGIAGAISSDLVKKYLAIKSQHPHEKDEIILERVWNFWLTLNAEELKKENDENKMVRLEIIRDKNDKKTAFDSLTALKTLFDLYQDILYIETEILSTDGKIWLNAMKVFCEKSREYGLDFKKEYESCISIFRKAKGIWTRF